MPRPGQADSAVTRDAWVWRVSFRVQEEEAEDAKRAKVSSNLGIVVRKPLNREDIISRDYNAELKARVGTKTLVSPDNPTAAGFFCKETGKTLRDSISYLDHINGKKRAHSPLHSACVYLCLNWT